MLYYDLNRKLYYPVSIRDYVAVCIMLQVCVYCFDLRYAENIHIILEKLKYFTFAENGDEKKKKTHL